MIDEAAIDDIPRLCELLSLLFSAEADFDPDSEKQAEGLRQIINRPEIGAILVYRDDGGIAGMVNLLYTVSTACGGRVAMLEDMIVSPEKRGRMIGTQLIEAAISRARTSGCLRVTLLTDSENHDAIRFYRKRGFSSSAMIPMRHFP